MRKFILASAALTTVATAQFQQVIPPGNAAVEGSSSTAYPWGSTTGSYRVQYVYDSSHFATAGINAPILINRIRWRANASAATTTWTGGSWANCIVSLSTSPLDYTAVSTTFASNHGPDLATVYTGPVTLIPGAGNGTGVPAPYFVDIAFSTPFLYDASLGDLNVDLQKDGTWTGGTTTSLDCETGATTSLTSRIYSLTGYLNTTGSTQQNVSVVMELSYSPPSGLYPNFTATPTTGAAPLNVQFNDSTFTSDPGGVLTWAWDFNGDGIVDSNLQNPSFVYTSCGDYNVSLTVTDATHGAATYTSNGFIVVDPITADFTATPTAGGTLPLVVQFTDTSSNATGWAWDFDNDGIVDSNLQSPLWAYTAPGFYSVALTTTNVCRTASVTKPSMIYAGGVILPAAVATIDGSSSNAYPLDYASQVHVQEVFDSSHFTGGGINSPILITAIHMRANGVAATWAGDTVSNLQVDLSTSPVDYMAMTTTYANQQGADLTTVYNAPLVIPAGSSVAGVPGPFFADIPFVAPFLYDPNSGDLTIEYLSNGVSNVANTPSNDTHLTVGQALARRLYNTANNAATTGTLYTTTGEIATVIALDYTPATGLYTAFTSDVTTGPSPLTVQFTDLTFSSDPAGVVAWQWDFDGDGIVDSNLQNPTYTYTTCGSFNVTLTAIDATHGPVTLTKPNYIVTDDLQASFTMQNMGGGVFQFTDTSVPTPTAWTWDFDGDNVIDSTLQNPTWTYPATCATNLITLTAYLNCRISTATDHAFVAPASLTAVPFTGGNGTSSTTVVGNMFDVQVTAPEGISICALTQAVYTYVGSFQADVYVTDGSYLGKDTNIANWRLVASGNGVSAGGGTTTPSQCDVPLNNSFYLPAGNYGIVILLSAQPSGTMYVCYTTGTAANWGPFSNGDLIINPNPTVAPGAAKYNLFGTGANSPRCWNGSFHYTKTSLSNTGGYGFFGAGCAGTMPVSTLSAAGEPRLGQPLSATADNVPMNVAVGVLGLSNTTSVFGPLPLDLAIIGAPGCMARVSVDAKALVLGVANSATWTIGLPNIPTLLGARAYQQMLLFDTTANSFGLVVSDAAGFVIGQ